MLPRGLRTGAGFVLTGMLAFAGSIAARADVMLPAKVAPSAVERGQRLAEAVPPHTTVHRKGQQAPVKPIPKRKKRPVEAERAVLAGGTSSTTFTLDLSAGVPAEVFTLASPYRVVIDLPNVNFRLPEGAGQKGEGLVSAFRFGLLSPGKARIVLDTTKPVLISKAEMSVRSGTAVRLSVELTATSAKAFGSGTGGLRKAAAAKPAADEDEPSKRRKARAKPVILIDPGHGGVDPGAISPSNLAEKKVVLAVARELKKRLMRGGHYDVHMTRTRDVFISLDERLKVSRKLDADLFISLHADSIKHYADTVRGATVYTLSERASDETARLMAEKENASDLIAGLDAGKDEEQGEVRSILIDLIKRETSNFSADFSNTLVERLGKTVSLSRDPQRSAAFKVLRQADTPSVLIELGYMSHKQDEKLLNSPAWQKKVADTIGNAVDSYFAKRTAKAR
jgi:N-acetylmuramoyl-L-alanine amidase